MRYTHDVMAVRKKQKAKMGAELAARIRELADARGGLAVLANEVWQRTGEPHDSSYFSHALAGNFRIGHEELGAVCEYLGIDPAWAFPEAGWPQVGEQEAGSAPRVAHRGLRRQWPVYWSRCRGMCRSVLPLYFLSCWVWRNSWVVRPNNQSRLAR